MICNFLAAVWAREPEQVLKRSSGHNLLWNFVRLMALKATPMVVEFFVASTRTEQQQLSTNLKQFEFETAIPSFRKQHEEVCLQCKRASMCCFVVEVRQQHQQQHKVELLWIKKSFERAEFSHFRQQVV